MTRRVAFRQADLARALRAAKAAGAPVSTARIDPDGQIVLQFGPAAESEAEKPDDWKARLRDALGWAQ